MRGSDPAEDFDARRVAKAAVEVAGGSDAIQAVPPSAIAAALDAQLEPLHRALDALKVRLDELDSRRT